MIQEVGGSNPVVCVLLVLCSTSIGDVDVWVESADGSAR